jgi:hypothetical protein
VTDGLFKFLRAQRIGPFSGVQWPDRGAGWIEATGPLAPCVNGVHLCRVRDLPYWINDELWEVETDGAILERGRKLVAARAQLRDRIHWWPEGGRELAADCAWRVRELASRELELVGESSDLPAASTLSEAADAAETVIGRLRPRGPASAKDMLGFLVDAIGYATDAESSAAAAARHTTLVAAIASGRASRVAGQRLAPGVTPYREERRRQAGWFALRLGLSRASA